MVHFEVIALKSLYPSYLVQPQIIIVFQIVKSKLIKKIKNFRNREILRVFLAIQKTYRIY
jgi:hypothetical protein